MEEDHDEDEPSEEEEQSEEEDPSSSPTPPSSFLIRASPALPSLTSHLVREIGHEAVWSLSTAKPGNGVDQIRDSSVDTYWQSDGGQPHLINIQFAKRASVSEVAFYLDYNLDESYTPRKMSVRVGMTFHDLEEVRVVELNEPIGWVSVPLRRMLDPLEDEEDVMEGERGKEGEEEHRMAIRKPVRAHFVQICVLAMHQNGRDTHIRQVKIFGPRNDAVRRGTTREGVMAKFTTVAMTQFDTIR